MIGLGVGLLVSQVADQPPRYDVDRLCKAVTQVQDGTGEKFAGCVKDESDAKVQIDAVWTLAKPTTRQVCAEKQTGQKSYVDVMTCMQLYEPTLSWKK
ncbi:MAG: hypothetical protein ACOYOJ_08070 [Alsobacter sp.]